MFFWKKTMESRSGLFSKTAINPRLQKQGTSGRGGKTVRLDCAAGSLGLPHPLARVRNFDDISAPNDSETARRANSPTRQSTGDIGGLGIDGWDWTVRLGHLDCRVATAPRNFDKVRIATASASETVHWRRRREGDLTVRLDFVAKSLGLPRRFAPRNFDSFCGGAG